MKEKWQQFYTRPITIQDFETSIYRSGFRLSKNTIGDALLIPNNKKMEGWHPAKQYLAYMKRLGSEILKPSWSYERHLREFVTKEKELHRSALVLAQSTGFKQILSNYLKFNRAWINYGTYIWTPWSITLYLEEWFVQQLQKKYDDWKEIYEVIARAEQPYRTQKMTEAVWKWKINRGSQKDFDRIIFKYAYLGAYSINDKVWSKENILHQAGNLNQVVIKLKESEESRKNNKKNFKKVYNRILKDDKILAKAAFVIHNYVWLRTERIDGYKRARVVSQPFFRKLEREMGWPFGWSAHLSDEELMKTLKTRRPSVDAKELKRRHEQDYVAYISPRKTIIISDPVERKKFLKKILGIASSEKIKEVTGQVGYKGLVKGRVQLIFHARDCYKFKKGSILVANMTHPDYMAAIRNASAIVTDEGGIVCHAAVISREFKIPAIIGTNQATKIFKDGDLVEVDANNGVVRKLK